jgi:hypothetical protein
LVERPRFFNGDQAQIAGFTPSIAADTDDGRDTDTSAFFHGIGFDIPTVRVGYSYTFGDEINEGAVVTDFVVRLKLGAGDSVFAQSRSEWKRFHSTLERNEDKTLESSIGMGYRRLVRRDLMVGANAFYDRARADGSWRSSSGAGVEVASVIAGSSVIDISVNYYGDLFTGGSSLTEFFRDGASSVGLEVGYTQPLADLACALRLKLRTYRIQSDSGANGFATGVDWTNCDGSLLFMYEYGNDKIHGDYQTVRGSVNLLFEPERILSLESPFAVPDSTFVGYDILRYYLGNIVRRERPALRPGPYYGNSSN